MKVLLISNMYPSAIAPSFGAFIKNIESGLQQQGADVTRAVIDRPLKKLWQKLAAYFILHIKVFKLLLRNKYDVVHLSYPSHLFLCLILTKCFSRSLVVVRIHGHEITPNRKGDYWIFIRRFITKTVVRFSDLVVLPSFFFRDKLLSLFGSIPKLNITVFPSGGVDRNVFFPGDYSQNVRPLNIGYIGRLERNKGVFELIESMRYLREVNLIMAGTGPDEKFLRDIVSRHSLRVEFKGAMHQIDLGNIYRSLDVLVFPTKYEESFGNVAIESMACGIPIIAPLTGAIPEYLKVGSNGLALSVISAQEISEVIEHFMGLPSSQRANFRRNCLLVAEQYDKTILMKKFVGELGLMLERGKEKVDK